MVGAFVLANKENLNMDGLSMVLWWNKFISQGCILWK